VRSGCGGSGVEGCKSLAGFNGRTYRHNMERIFRWDEKSDSQALQEAFSGQIPFTHKVHYLYNLQVAMKPFLQRLFTPKTPNAMPNQASYLPSRMFSPD
jgi:hypothetical protein